MLGQNIDKIRASYHFDWYSSRKNVRQRSVVVYFIDKLAFRMGDVKTDVETDEEADGETGEKADTASCCSLRVGHLKLIEPRSVEYDFVGKDSIRYHNVVEVERQVYKNLRLFIGKKEPQQRLFHRVTVRCLNNYMESLMPGLSAEAFRKYNASFSQA